MGLRFAKMERKLGEVNRARAIYQHMSQFCNPRVRENEEQFWTIWEKFEVYHGNEDTYSDYMRTKRTVEIRFSVAMPVLTGMAAGDSQVTKEKLEFTDDQPKAIEAASDNK